MKTKKLFLTLVTLLTISSVIPVQTGATPPPWAPANGYRAKTTHIFLPDQNMYYDLRNDVYIFENNGQWEKTANMPEKFAGVDFKNAKQVELESTKEEPYLSNIKHNADYHKAVQKEQEQYLKEQKNALKDAQTAQKEADKARKEAEKKQKEIAKAQKQAEKQQKELEKARKKAEKEQKAIEKKQKQIEKAQAKAAKAQKQAEKAQAKVAKQTEKAQRDAEKAKRNAEKAQKKANKVLDKNS